MALLKGKRMAFRAFESEIFSNRKESEKSEQSINGVKYNSLDHESHKLSKIFFIQKIFK